MSQAQDNSNDPLHAKKKAWSGRFSEPVDAFVLRYTASVDFDKRMALVDIDGSVAHATMLAKVGVISEQDLADIKRGMAQIREEIQTGKFEWQLELEDVHLNIEARLTALIGDAGKRLHTGRSRNDQVATDIRLYLRGEIDEIIRRVEHLQEVLVAQTEKNYNVIMPGFTHMQVAQPVTFGHHMLAYVEMLERDHARLIDLRHRVNSSPLGAAALAGTTYPIDREYTAKLLGFETVAQNSLDAVSDRDFAIEFCAAASLIMAHISRLSEELVIWMSQRFGFIKLPDRFTTGSSIMPQKKNPDIAELARGKSGRLIGDLTGLLATLKGLPTAYARDLQEDKEAVFDQVDTLEVLLPAFTGMVRTMHFDGDRLEEEAPTGFALATDIAEWLVKNGVPFRHAHELSGACVKLAEGRGQELWDLTDNDFIETFAAFLPADKAPGVREVLSSHGSVDSRNGKGGTAYGRVREQIADAKAEVEELKLFPASTSDGSAYKAPGTF